MREQTQQNSTSGPTARLINRRRMRPPRVAAFLALTISGFLGVILVLAGQTNVPQITRAPGTILPFGDYAQIETLHGGVVRAVHVRNGQTVEAGQLLVELDHPDLSREQDIMTGQISAIIRQTENAKTVLSMLDSETLPSDRALDEIRSRGLTNAAARLDLYSESQTIQQVSIQQQEGTLRILQDAAELSAARVERKQDLLARYAQLRARGLKTLSDYLEEEDEVEAVRIAASDARVRLAQAENALNLARASMAEETLALREEVLTKLSDLDQERAELIAALKIVGAQIASLAIVAPARGVVQAAAYPNPGEVIAPGEVLFELSPTHDALLVEARIPNADIGHVDTSQPVSVSVDTFDVRRFGKIQGRLQTVYPMPLTDERTGETYFRASFVLAEGNVGRGPYERPLQAGMTVVAEITTGEQTLLSYMLKPVQTTLGRAFNER